jgi:hypothetical protein
VKWSYRRVAEGSAGEGVEAAGVAVRDPRHGYGDGEERDSEEELEEGRNRRQRAAARVRVGLSAAPRVAHLRSWDGRDAAGRGGRRDGGDIDQAPRFAFLCVPASCSPPPGLQHTEPKEERRRRRPPCVSRHGRSSGDPRRLTGVVPSTPRLVPSAEDLSPVADLPGRADYGRRRPVPVLPIEEHADCIGGFDGLSGSVVVGEVWMSTTEVMDATGARDSDGAMRAKRRDQGQRRPSCGAWRWRWDLRQRERRRGRSGGDGMREERRR